MEVMAKNVLYCQRCATPHPSSFPWIIWQKIRLDSQQCKDQFIKVNADILQQELLIKEETKQIAEKFRVELLTNPHKREKYKRKLKPIENLDKYVFWKPKKIRTSWFSGYYKKNINCPSCDKIIPKTYRKCSHCLNYTKPINLDYPTKKRNEEIVLLLNQGIYTLQEIGDRFGFSRERTRQIYFKLTGKKYTLRKQKADHDLKILHTAQQEAKAKEIKFACLACSKSVTYGEAGAKHQYCNKCHAIAFDQFRDPKVKFTCRSCRVEFHPLRNWKTLKLTPKYCSNKCYFKNRKFLDIQAFLDKREARERGFEAFYFRYMQVEKGIRP